MHLLLQLNNHPLRQHIHRPKQPKQHKRLIRPPPAPNLQRLHQAILSGSRPLDLRKADRRKGHRGRCLHPLLPTRQHEGRGGDIHLHLRDGGAAGVGGCEALGVAVEGEQTGTAYVCACWRGGGWGWAIGLDLERGVWCLMEDSWE
jgi:hypothetical protein